MLSPHFRNLRSKRGYRRLGDGYILLDGPRTCSHGADDASVQRDRDAAAEDDDLADVGFLDAIKGSAGLRHASQIGGRFVEDSRGRRFVDGKVDASDERSVLTDEGQQMASGIDDADIITFPLFKVVPSCFAFGRVAASI